MKLREVFHKHREMFHPYIKVQMCKDHHLGCLRVDVFSTLKLNVYFETWKYWKHTINTIYLG